MFGLHAAIAVDAGLMLSDTVVAAAARQQLPSVLSLLNACCDAEPTVQGSKDGRQNGGLSKLYMATIEDDPVGGPAD
jgi:hypothetical protein